MRANGSHDAVRSFNDVLDQIIAGKLQRVPSDTGLDQQTTDMLNLLARQPDKNPSDIAACRVEFGRQLDGTHAAEDDAKILKLLAGL